MLHTVSSMSKCRKQTKAFKNVDGTLFDLMKILNMKCE
jgi:hypothetical protein